MKNSRIYKIALPLLLAFSLSCSEDLLDVDPVGEYFSENYYVNEDQVYGALIGAYGPIGWSMAYGQWISPVMMGEIRSDNANAGGNAAGDDQIGWQEIDDFSEEGTNAVVQPFYRRCYIGIARANTVLEKVEIASPVIDDYKAEAKFLRAYYHFELFKNFGPIPVIDRLLAPNEINLKRSSMTEVFEMIESDLQAAISELPVDYPASETGRATKGAAQALLGKVYLYWADMDDDNVNRFDDAAEQFEAVINSNLYQLEPNYGDLFQYGARHSTEAIFEIQHSNLSPSDWGWFEGIDGNGMVQLCGIRGLCGDHPEYKAGWGFMMVTESLYSTYLADEDSRKNSTVISEDDLNQEIIDAGFSCDAIDMSDVNDDDYDGYWQIKYANYKAYDGNNVNGGNPDLTKDANVYSIRLADVYLMLAEAQFRGNGTEADALANIDIVRARAGVRTAAEVMSDEGWDFDQLLDYERRVELALEGHRWYDLVRSGKADASLFDALRSGNYVQNENPLWLPISNSETEIATSLTTYPSIDLFN